MKAGARVTIVLQGADKAWMQRVGEVARRHLKSRVGLVGRVVDSADDATPKLVLVERAVEGGEEAFAIETRWMGKVPTTTISGVSRGLIYGAGRFLREIKRQGGNVLWPNLNLSDAPALRVRGIYYPTQVFYPGTNEKLGPPMPFNTYNAWLWKEGKFEEFENVLIEQMLWGLNTIGLWYAEWMDEPWGGTAFGKKMGGIYKRLRAMAKSWRLQVCLLMTSNLAPAKTFQKYKRHGNDVIPRGLWGQFPVPCMLCPSVPAVRKYLVDYRRRLIEMLEPDWIELFPTDPGGCDCAKCRPWSKTYWGLAKELLSPYQGKIAMRSINFWYFWNAQAKELAAKVAKTDAINAVCTQKAWQEDTGARLKITDSLARRGKTVIFWPDITMIGGWGIYGTYPWIKGLRELFVTAHDVHGVLPYTEGPYDDVNKFTMLLLAWKPKQELQQVVTAILEGMHNEKVPREAVDAVLAVEARDFASANKLLAAAERKLDRKTTTSWQWYSLRFYARHAGVGDTGEALFKSIEERAKKSQPTRKQLVGWRGDAAALEVRVRAAVKEMPRLYKAVNHFQKPYDMFCGTRLRDLKEMKRLTKLDAVESKLAALAGAGARGGSVRGDARQAMNLHESGAKKRK